MRGDWTSMSGLSWPLKKKPHPESTREALGWVGLLYFKEEGMQTPPEIMRRRFQTVSNVGKAKKGVSPHIKSCRAYFSCGKGLPLSMTSRQSPLNVALS